MSGSLTASPIKTFGRRKRGEPPPASLSAGDSDFLSALASPSRPVALSGALPPASTSSPPPPSSPSAAVSSNTPAVAVAVADGTKPRRTLSDADEFDQLRKSEDERFHKVEYLASVNKAGPESVRTVSAVALSIDDIADDFAVLPSAPEPAAVAPASTSKSKSAAAAAASNGSDDEFEFVPPKHSSAAQSTKATKPTAASGRTPSAANKTDHAESTHKPVRRKSAAATMAPAPVATKSSKPAAATTAPVSVPAAAIASAAAAKAKAAQQTAAEFSSPPLKSKAESKLKLKPKSASTATAAAAAVDAAAGADGKPKLKQMTLSFGAAPKPPAAAPAAASNAGASNGSSSSSAVAAAVRSGSLYSPSTLNSAGVAASNSASPTVGPASAAVKELPKPKPTQQQTLPFAGPVRAASEPVRRIGGGGGLVRRKTTAGGLSQRNGSGSAFGDSFPLSQTGGTIAEMRKRNLANKSKSQLLLDAVMGVSSPELERLMQSLAVAAANRDAAAAAAAKSKAGVAAANSGSAVAAPAVPLSASLSMARRKRVKSILTSIIPGASFVGDADRLLELTVHFLLQTGADPNTEDADGHSPLLIAVQLRHSHNIVRWCLAANAEPNPSAHSLTKRMYWTANQQHEAIAAAQAATAGASASAAAGSGSSAASASDGSAAGVSTAPKPKLKLSKFNPNRTNSNPSVDPAPSRTGSNGSNGSTGSGSQPTVSVGAGSASRMAALNPDDAPMPSSYVDIALALNQPAVVLLLLKAGGMPSSPTSAPLLSFARANGFGAWTEQFLARTFWSAVRDDDSSLVATLLLHPIEVDAVDSQGRTPLFYAIEKNLSFEVVEMLLRSKRADPNHLDASGHPMIMFPLLRHGKAATKTLSLLLECGANPSITLPIDSFGAAASTDDKSDANAEENDDPLELSGDANRTGGGGSGAAGIEHATTEELDEIEETDAVSGDVKTSEDDAFVAAAAAAPEPASSDAAELIAAALAVSDSAVSDDPFAPAPAAVAISASASSSSASAADTPAPATKKKRSAAAAVESSPALKRKKTGGSNAGSSAASASEQSVVAWAAANAVQIQAKVLNDFIRSKKLKS